jgi:hypothetical protein
MFQKKEKHFCSIQRNCSSVFRAYGGRISQPTEAGRRGRQSESVDKTWAALSELVAIQVRFETILDVSCTCELTLNAIEKIVMENFQFISNLQNGDVICATLKHANALSEYYVVFPKLLKKLLRQLVKIWSRLSSVDTARVQAFVNLMKIVQLTNTFASLIMRVRFETFRILFNPDFKSSVALPRLRQQHTARHDGNLAWNHFYAGVNIFKKMRLCNVFMF